MNNCKIKKRVQRSFYYLFLAGLIFLLGACQNFWNGDDLDKKPEQEKKQDKKKEEKEEKEEDRFAFLKSNQKEFKYEDKEESMEAEQINDSVSHRLKDTREKASKMPKSALQPSPVKPKAPLHFYDDFIILNGDEEIEVNLVFNNAPLIDVLPSFADALGFNFLADSDLKGNVTLNIDQKMARKDLWNTFDKMLNLSGAGVVVDGTLLRIMSLNKFPRATDSRFSKDGSGELLYFPLKNTIAKEAAQQIRQFLGINAVCVELTRPNAIMIADSRANMPKIKQVLEHLDMAGKAGWKRKVVICNNILPSRLTEELSTVLPVLGFNVYKKTDRTEQPGSVQLTGVDRLQVVVISAATDEAIKEIEQWIDLLDASDSLDQERVFVYKVRNNRAVNLTRALAMIYEMQGASMTIDSNTGNTRTENINSSVNNFNRNRTNTNNRNTTAATKSENTQTDFKSSVFATPVRVFSDGVLNRLVIRTTPRTYASIKALLNRLDVVPAQVLLQVLVVEVTLTESTQFGLEFSAMASNGNTSNTLIGTNYKSMQNLKPANAEEGFNAGTSSGIGAMIQDPTNPQSRFGYIQALAGDGTVKVISSPQLLVSSHSEAQINVGTQVPIVTGAVTNSTSDGNLTKTYKYQDTGVTLTVTPQVTSTNLISLKVKQILSTITSNTATDVENPLINQRLVETDMTIANGRTMIIGGLIQEKVTDDLESIPFLKEIPVLNRLLGSTTAKTERSEILVLVTGYIINEKSQLEELIKRYNDAIKTLNNFEKANGEKRKSTKSSSLLTTKEFWTDGTIMENK